uniref:Uncharacterized protein n=1 Tax=Spumella elongata TaxID=89044 RepID=A0A7S3HAL9_9STRA|mmetsp:Transcript_43045/g.74829  ORF Transcript_43045/g.74829 Transcript_43045/m.74829 type:complete len:715 (+) Transcript_43045:31-2175(+)|eukprot:CAMPEP_0184988030 /NCGR_PEP_ID=MMETSP1098-20130426/22747_1 /TAXON_ID=89044 /ORGANISM="Spumella elongata, Strain CCAP 955/1" /LENGTH=714 /DNA_ID=CAMNT_0027512687 /DNA_START=15 /DNA_END=2159 /DNA_ORIENTATION=-
MSLLEQELRLIVPLKYYVDLSTVPDLYLTAFRKKLAEQPGAQKLSKLFEEFPQAFRVKQVMGTNQKSLIWSVIQIPSKRVPATIPKVVSTPASQKTAPKDPAPKPETSKPGALQVTKRAPNVELNNRSEVSISLMQLTTSLRSPQFSVPLGGLAGFICSKKATSLVGQSASLITDTAVGAKTKVGSSILGFNAVNDTIGEKTVYLDTTDPFCAVCIGVQGAGKSHTMNVILENCMLNTVSAENISVVSIPQPMCGLVLHYDQSESNCCEAVGLKSPAASLSLYPDLKVQRLVVLASPTYYLQRKAFYGNSCEVIPLLFDWDTLTATQLKKLMRLSDSDAQLYVSVILNKLREYQRKNKIPSFDGFLDEVMALCNVQGQNAPLQQRLELLKTVVRESAPNEDLREHSHSLASLMQAGTLVVADLTDPMMSADEACGVFQVLLEQFRGHPLGDVGKVVTFDEAHKYLNKSGPGCVELSNAIVDTVRLMRHEGIRVLISTQSPLTMPPELLELTSVTILHKFQSADWAKYLGSKVTLPPDGFHEIQSLEQGQALLLSTQISASERGGAGESNVVNHLKVNIRPRLTLDLGASRRNRSGPDENSAEDFVVESECQSLSPSDDVGSGEEQGTGSEYKGSYEDSDADYGSIKDSEEEPEESQSLWRERLSQSENEVIGADIDIDTRSFEALRNSAGGERNGTNSAGLLGAAFKELDIGDW